MMQGKRNHLCRRKRSALDPAAVRGVLVQAIVCSVLVIVTNEIRKEPPQVLFIQRSHMVQQLPPAASHPAFRHSVLPGSLPVRLGCKPIERKVLSTSASNLLSRSRIA